MKVSLLDGSDRDRSRVWLGRQLSTGRALYDSAAGWQPIDGAAYNIRWPRNSGTGNYTASQTAHYIGLGGGGLLNNVGEGEHVVLFSLF